MSVLSSILTVVYSGELSIKPSSVDAKIINDVLVVVFYGETTLVFAFNLNNSQLIFQDYGNLVNLSNYLEISKDYKTIIPASVVYRWNLNLNPTLNDKECYLKKSIYDINDNLLPLSYLQLISVGASVNKYISPNLKDREKDLIDFISKPHLLFPYYKDDKKVVAVYENHLSLYELTLSNNLIENIVDELN